jgi:hypothetical protein
MVLQELQTFISVRLMLMTVTTKRFILISFCFAHTLGPMLCAIHEPFCCFFSNLEADERDWAVPIPEGLDGWEMAQMTDEDLMPEFSLFTLKQLVSYGLETRVNIGKYAGQSFAEIAKDQEYSQWLTTVSNNQSCVYFSKWYSAWASMQ